MDIRSPMPQLPRLTLQLQPIGLHSANGNLQGRDPATPLKECCAVVAGLAESAVAAMAVAANAAAEAKSPTSKRPFGANPAFT